jgi:hypothetical protein
VRALLFVPVAVLVLSACGGSSTHYTTGLETTSAQNAKAQITRAYEKFFSNKTTVDGKVSLLENGPQFKSVIRLFASNPLAKNASATVSSVTLQGGKRASVVYVVKLGSASLGKQRGTAVRQNGVWKVGYAGLCRLVGLGGSLPPACRP